MEALREFSGRNPLLFVVLFLLLAAFMADRAYGHWMAGDGLIALFIEIPLAIFGLIGAVVFFLHWRRRPQS